MHEASCCDGELDCEVGAWNYGSGGLADQDLGATCEVEDIANFEVREDQTCERGGLEVAKRLVEAISRVFGPDYRRFFGRVPQDANKTGMAATMVGVHVVDRV